MALRLVASVTIRSRLGGSISRSGHSPDHYARRPMNVPSGELRLWMRPALAIVVAACVVSSAAACGVQPLEVVPPTPTSTGLPLTLSWSVTDEGILFSQGPVLSPTSEAAAVAAALATIEADNWVVIALLRGGVDWNSVSAFERGSHLDDTTNFVTYVGDDQTFAGFEGQPPLWIPDVARTVVSDLAVDGGTYPYGLVRTIGCYESRGSIVWESDPPEPSPPFSPFEIVVEYDPQSQTWFVTEQTPLTDQDDAPECPPAS